MKNKFVIIFSWALVVATMLIIFNFSKQPGKQSAAVSEGVIVQILDVFLEKEEITPPVINKFQLPIRKIAHFGIYMLLAFCMISAFEKTFKLKLMTNSLLSVVSCAIYAVSDEIHQNFSANRGPSVTDVLIDTGGAILGVALYLLFLHLYNKYQNKSRIQN